MNAGQKAAADVAALLRARNPLLWIVTREEARAVADEYNRTSTRSRVEVYVLAGEIAQDDAEAARAISAEVRELMSDMEAGIQRADPERIREAANKARALGGMLSPAASGRVTEAIEQARKAAREIVKRVEKAGETAAAVVRQLATDRIQAARFAFLDMDDEHSVEAIEAPARAVDLSPVEPAAAVQAAPQTALEF